MQYLDEKYQPDARASDHPYCKKPPLARRARTIDLIPIAGDTFRLRTPSCVRAARTPNARFQRDADNKINGFSLVRNDKVEEFVRSRGSEGDNLVVNMANGSVVKDTFLMAGIHGSYLRAPPQFFHRINWSDAQAVTPSTTDSLGKVSNRANLATVQNRSANRSGLFCARDA